MQNGHLVVVFLNGGYYDLSMWVLSSIMTYPHDYNDESDWCISCGQPVNVNDPILECSCCKRTGCLGCMPYGNNHPCPECEVAEKEEKEE